MKPRLRGLAAAAVAIGVVGVVAVIGLAVVPLWPLPMLEYFRLQFLELGVVVTLACAALRMGRWFDAALMTTIFAAWWVLPDLGMARQTATGTRVRVLVLNVHTQSSSFAQVRALIDEVHADIVGLVEVDDRWLAGLALTGYQHLEEPRTDNFGVALFAKAPMQAQIKTLGTAPSIIATIDIAGGLGVILTHPPPPVYRSWLPANAAQLRAVGARAKTLGRHVLVIGDFNATPWSRPFDGIVEESGLCDTRAGFGVQASYPAESVLLRIPIDHVLASCDIGVDDRRIERDVGSDHLPVVVDLVVP